MIPPIPIYLFSMAFNLNRRTLIGFPTSSVLVLTVKIDGRKKKNRKAKCTGRQVGRMQANKYIQAKIGPECSAT